jgi:predicted nucleic acid-binding protein
MILLDTNVISEPLRATGNTNVLAWIDGQAIETLYLSAISLAELRYSVAALPEGKRREALHNGLELQILPLFTDRVLSFDAAASKSYAVLRARAKLQGKAMAPVDGYVAAIAAAHGFIIATRDVAPFLAAGIKVINPWEVE